MRAAYTCPRSVEMLGARIERDGMVKCGKVRIILDELVLGGVYKARRGRARRSTARERSALEEIGDRSVLDVAIAVIREARESASASGRTPKRQR